MPRLSTCVVVIMAALLSMFAHAAERPPNIVLIFCDNLGYGDIEVYNPNAKQPTPRLLKLAEESTVFDHAYCAAPVCTPSRGALMTGCYPRRIGLDRTPAPPGHVLTPASPNGLHPNEITIAELLRDQGYRSICIGKWHLGDQPPFLPLNQGFDEYFGIPYSDNMKEEERRNFPPLPLIEGNEVIEAEVDVNTLVRRGTERALRFIEENRERPFFLYFPQITPGSEAKPPAHPDFQGKSQNGPWGDSVMELDWSTGQLIDKLNELGLSENTLFIWTNDNGAPQEAKRGGSSDPLKGEAYNTSEGGMRVPLIVRWPGKVPEGIRNSEMITLMDCLPTLVALAGGTDPQDRIIDGRDIRPLLFGEPNAKSPHEAFFFWHLDQLQAVRSGPWKLYLGGDRRVGFATQAQKAKPSLYHLIDDPQEKKDVHADHPDIVAKLERLADQTRADLGEYKDHGPGCRPVGVFENPTPRLLKP